MVGHGVDGFGRVGAGRHVVGGGRHCQRQRGVGSFRLGRQPNDPCLVWRRHVGVSDEFWMKRFLPLQW